MRRVGSHASWQKPQLIFPVAMDPEAFSSVAAPFILLSSCSSCSSCSASKPGRLAAWPLARDPGPWSGTRGLLRGPESQTRGVGPYRVIPTHSGPDGQKLSEEMLSDTEHDLDVGPVTEERPPHTLFLTTGV